VGDNVTGATVATMGAEVGAAIGTEVGAVTGDDVSIGGTGSSVSDANGAELVFCFIPFPFLTDSVLGFFGPLPFPEGFIIPMDCFLVILLFLEFVFGFFSLCGGLLGASPPVRKYRRLSRVDEKDDVLASESAIVEPSMAASHLAINMQSKT
jgi:hypothetical protein